MPWRTKTIKAKTRKQALKMFREDLLKNREVTGSHTVCHKTEKDAWDAGYFCNTYAHKLKKRRRKR